MMERKWFKVSALVLEIILAAFVGILSFFIVHNAEWLIGDDAIVINKTGWGTPFSIWTTIQPEVGRFFPLAYMHENIVLLFPGEMHSAAQHYVLNMILFILLALALLKTLWLTIKPEKIVDLFIVLMGVILCLSRFFITYCNLFSTVYSYLTITGIIVLCVIQYYTTRKKVYAVIPTILFAYLVFCGECVFIAPLALGVVTLLFGYKQLSKEQKIFNICIVSVPILFLLVYFFGIYLQTTSESLYDPSHGTGVTFIENALKIIKGQKFLILAALVWGLRQLVLIFKKDSYHVLYDSFLWTAGAILLGGLILKLDWHLYYYSAMLYALPSVVFFGKKYFKEIPLLIILVLFAILYSYKVPRVIQTNQKDRIKHKEFVTYIVDQHLQGQKIVWHETVTNDTTSFDLILRNWKRNALRTYIQYELKDRTWEYAKSDIYDECIVLYSKENDTFGIRPASLSGLASKNVYDIALYEINKCNYYEHTIQ